MMLKRIGVRLVILTCWLISSSAFSNSFFDAYVPVEDRGQKAFKLASQAALLQVFEKATAKNENELLSHVAIENALKQAHTKVTQFKYVELDASPHIENGRDKKTSSTLWLSLRLNQSWTSKQLQQANLKLLLERRPKTIVIGVVQIDNKLKILDQKAQYFDASLNRQLQASTALGVVPHQLPQSQLQKLSVTKLWYFNQEYIRNIALTNGADAIIVTRLARVSDGRWVGGAYYQDVTTSNLTGSLSVDLNNVLYQEALKPIFTQVNKRWVSKYAVRLNQSQNEIVLNVSNLSDFDSFKQLQSALESLSVVDHVYVIESQKTSIKLSVVLKSDYKSFYQKLSSIKRLQITSGDSESAYMLDGLWQ